MNSKKSIIVSTSFGLGLLIFLFLIISPSIKLYFTYKTQFNKFMLEFSKSYNEADVPTIKLSPNEIRANNDIPFTKVIQGNAQSNESFSIFIDTRQEPDMSYIDKVKENTFGVIIYRENIIIHSVQSNKSPVTIPIKEVFSKLKIKKEIIIDKKFIDNLATKFGNIIFIIILIGSAIIDACLKLLLFIVIALIYSGKAKICGGGHYSLAIWAQVPPTIFQLVMPTKFSGCCSCGIYLIILIISVIVMEKQLVPEKAEE